MQPSFVLMDEPAAGLPEAEVPEFAAVVRAVRDDHGAGVLLIDHNMALIMDVCDRIHVLDQGPRWRRALPARSEPTSTSRPPTSVRARCTRKARVSAAMLEISGLDVSYGGVAAVRQVSIEVGKGEIVGLIGPNGAGKSTTLHAMMGLVSARSGEIRLAGKSLLGRAPEAVACAGISLVPEGRRIFAELTVEENLRLGLLRAPLARGRR